MARTPGLALNTLNINGVNVTFANASDYLYLTAGGLMHQGASSSIGASVGSGFLAPGSAASTGATPLYVDNGANTLTINSDIADPSAGSQTRLVVTLYNGGQLVLTNANTYSGGTVLNGWVGGTSSNLNLQGSAGTVVIPAGGLTINDAALVENTNGGQIAPANVVTMNGGSSLTLVSTNTLAGLAFNNNGGAAPNLVTTGGVLTLTGSISATSSNPANVSVMTAGTIDLNGNNSFPLVVSPVQVNGQNTNASNLGNGATLLVSATVQDGGLAISGGGLVQFNTSATYAGGTTLSGAGTGIVVGTATALGTNAITMGAGTVLTADTSGGRTLTNPLVLSGNSVTFGDPYASTLTLSGVENWNASSLTLTANAVSGTSFNVQTLSGPIVGSGSIIKQGPGVLQLSGNNTGSLNLTGADAIQILNGTLQINATNISSSTSADVALGFAPPTFVANNISIDGGVFSYSTSVNSNIYLNPNRGILLGAATAQSRCRATTSTFPA